jgi:hypothetical protein
LCTLYVKNQLCVTYLSRTFVTYSEYYIAFWPFPWEVTPSRLLEICPVRKILRKYSISETQLFCSHWRSEEKRKNREGNKVKEQRKIESVSSPNTSGLQRQKMQEKNSSKKIFIIKRHLKIPTWNAERDWKTTCKQLRTMTGSNVWVAETDCRSSVLHTKTNASTAVESYWERKTAICRRGCRIFRSLQLRLLSSLRWNIVYLWYIYILF